jgi:hypothetical protein
LLPISFAGIFYSLTWNMSRYCDLYLFASLLAAIHVTRLTVPVLGALELNSMHFPRIQDAW